ncbi:hypothetical protein GCM10009030_00880 [Haloarcula pellucida]|uniref:Uncharacterized protein n=1 Tax=Haloarcula pellucida TaxID=1427151 RepID=A0A830GI32_9EURY|nr:hypothetical protein GCM10009030_00880 [Halomicroarcula pellucida]
MAQTCWGKRKNYAGPGRMVTLNMTPTKIRERLEESEGRVDTEKLVSALEYVRDDGRRRH